MSIRLCKYWIFLALGFVGPWVVAQEVIYDNTTHATSIFYRFGREYGDEVEVAGTARRVTEFTFRYFGDIPSGYTGGTFRIRFYANDGPDFLPGRLTGLMPGTVLWDSGEQPMGRGLQTPVLQVPGVDVPNRFTWTVFFSGVTGAFGNSAGLIIADPPTVGHPLEDGRIGSYWDAWIKNQPLNDRSWTLINFGFNPDQPKANFYARVSAVEAPINSLRVVRGPTGAQLIWPSVAGQRYLIQYTDEFPMGTWQFLAHLVGEDGTGLFHDASISGNFQRYYRIVQQDSPDLLPIQLIVQPGRLVIQWPALVGAEYAVETANELSHDAWELRNRVFPATATGRLIHDLTDAPSTFFRVWRIC
jgi:hypothetical protein